MNKAILRAAICAAVASVALAACDREAANSADRNAATVGQKIDKALDRTQQQLAVAGEKTKETLNSAGEKTRESLNAAGQKISTATDNAVANTREAARDVQNSASDRATTASASGISITTPSVSPETRAALGDTAITASIKADFLKDPDLSVLKIDVDTRDGVVTLNGLAGNEAARKRAEQMAASVKGVREVRNYLTVKRA